MKNKTLAVFSLSVLILLALVSFVSATSSVTATITGTSGDSFSLSNPYSIQDSKDNIVLVTLSPTSGTIPSSGSLTLTATISSEIPSNFGLGTFSHTFSDNVTIKLKNNLCSYEDNGNLDINIENIKIVKGFGDNTEWYPLDEVETRINVENNGDDDIRNIVVKWELYDQTTQTKIISGEEDDFTLNDGDEKELVINFQLDKLSKLKYGDKYVLYAWATGRDRSMDNEYTCVSTTNEESEEDSIILNIDNSFVILDAITIADSISCGSQIEITGKAWNIGENDEEDVYIKVYNTELGINQKVDLGDIDSLEDNTFSFILDIPTDADEKTYDLNFLVFDDSDDIFENDNGDQSKTNILLNIDSGCSIEALASISASLDSSAVAGKELIIKAIVTNTDSKINTFTLGLDQYSNWASLENIDKTSVTLNAGDSQEVIIKLKVNNDASGDQNFNIVAKQGDKVLSQPVSVSIAKSFIFPNFSGMFSGSGEDNSYLYGIIALNVLLVLIIIIVATKMAKKKKE